MKCPKCSKISPKNSKRCVHCGSILSRETSWQKFEKIKYIMCPHCQNEIPEGSGYCRSCGKRITDEVVSTEIKIENHIENHTANINKATIINNKTAEQKTPPKKELNQKPEKDDKGEHKVEPESDNRKYIAIAGIVLALLLLIVIMFNQKDEQDSSHPELEAYAKYISNNDWILNYEGNPEDKSMAVFDLNQDGVWEIFIDYCGTDWGNYSSALLSYSGSDMIVDLNHSLENDNVGVTFEICNEENGKYILGRTRGKVVSTVMQLNANGYSTMIGSFCESYWDDWSDDEREEYYTQMQGMKEPIFVQMNEDNINRYLSGDGETTGMREEWDLP